MVRILHRLQDTATGGGGLLIAASHCYKSNRPARGAVRGLDSFSFVHRRKPVLKPSLAKPLLVNHEFVDDG